MSRTFRVTSPAMPVLLGMPALELHALTGEERLSELFRYNLLLKTPANPAIAWQSAANLNLKDLVGKEMTVHLSLDAQGERYISGMVTQARFLERDAMQAVYEVQLAPWLHLGTLTSDYRIFQEKDVVTILREVLSDYDYPVDFRLAGSYPSLEYQVQYGETDFHFMQRLMEEWGIYWFFEHTGDTHRLVLVDHASAHRPFPSPAYQVLHYYPPGHRVDHEYIADFRVSEGLRPGQWVTDDYDFRKSRASLRAMDRKPRKTSHNAQELYQWPGDYDDPKTGEQLSRIRMEAEGAPGSRSVGSGNVRAIVCGTTFTLQDFPYDKANREYLVIGTELSLKEAGQTSGQGAYDCHVQFEVQPASKIYRAPQRTPKPYTHGPQTAIVVGPKGEEIWTDEYGRVKVAFHWDRYARQDENDSCWIRVSQAWAGTGFGGMYIPRIGQEVIVDFMGGDPDRPVVIGNLYNNVTSPPWSLPENATQSGVISRSLRGKRSNFNGVRFEDQQGEEEFRVQAERDMNTLVKGNSRRQVRQSATRQVGGNDVSNVLGHSSRTVGLGSSTTIGAFHALNVAGASSTTVGMARGVNVLGAENHIVGLGYTMGVGGDYGLQAIKGITFTCGLSSLTLGPDGTITMAGTAITISASGGLKLQGSPVDINPGDPPPAPPVVLPLPIVGPTTVEAGVWTEDVVDLDIFSSGIFPFV